MKKTALPAVLLLCIALISCSKNDSANQEEAGFNREASDEKAMDIANKVMAAMGGHDKWENSRYFSWNFFGKRDLVWDKQTGDVRIHSFDDSTLYLMNINDMKGKVFEKGNQITDPAKLEAALKTGKGIWINDSYWLFMPFKLQDPGVTLKYLRLDATQKGQPAHVLQLTFEDVGYTPENKYEVYVDTADYLVKQWAYFKSYEQDSASAVWPWDNYQNYDGLLLSADRSDNGGPRDVKVFNDLPAQVFTDPKMDGY